MIEEQEQKIYLTTQGLAKAKEELDFLIHTKRKEIVLRIERAKELGDLSENAEYNSAKEEQGFTEGRIAELDHLLKNAEVVSNNGPAGIVRVGSKVKVKVEGVDKEYEVVGANEADPLAGKISNESPLGQALIGHKKEDKFTVKAPRGPKEYEIINIS